MQDTTIDWLVNGYDDKAEEFKMFCKMFCDRMSLLSRAEQEHAFHTLLPDYIDKSFQCTTCVLGVVKKFPTGEAICCMLECNQLSGTPISIADMLWYRLMYQLYKNGQRQLTCTEYKVNPRYVH